MRKRMDKDLKNRIKHFAEETEIGAARSILKWKYKKKGMALPSEGELTDQSRKVARYANDVFSKTGRSVWNDLKAVYVSRKDKEGGTGKDGC
jgi:hypothetical protein